GFRRAHHARSGRGCDVIWACVTDRGRISLPARDRADDEERFRAGRDFFGQRGVWRLVRHVLLAGEEPHERAALLGHVIADRAAERSEEHTSELQSLRHLVCRLLLEKKKRKLIERQCDYNGKL